MVFVAVNEFVMGYSWGETETLSYAPRKHNHYQAKKLAEKLGFECPAYPQETENGYAVFTRLIEKQNVTIRRKRVDQYNDHYQMATVEQFEGLFERITFSAEGYNLEQFEEPTSQIVEVEDEVYYDSSYSNGVGRWADHR